MGLMEDLEALMEGAGRTDLSERTSMQGEYTVLGVDKFDYTDWVEGKYATAQEAIDVARKKTAEAAPYASSNSIATVYYAYDPKGNYIGP